MVLLCLGAAACKDPASSDAPSAPAAAPAQGAPAPAAAPAAAAPGHPEVATVELPPVTRAWVGADYQLVATAMSTGQLPMPMFIVEPGASLLGRITSEENLGYQRNTTVPVQQRLQDFMAMQPAMGTIATSYAHAGGAGQPVNRELAAVVGFMIRLSASGAALLEEYVPTIPRDANYDRRMEGMASVRSGLAQVILGAEQTLKETQFYSPDDLSVIIDAMADSLPAMKRLLDDAVQAELRGKLEAHRQAAAARPQDAAAFDRMLAELKPAPAQ